MCPFDARHSCDSSNRLARVHLCRVCSAHRVQGNGETGQHHQGRDQGRRQRENECRWSSADPGFKHHASSWRRPCAVRGGRFSSAKRLARARPFNSRWPRWLGKSRPRGRPRAGSLGVRRQRRPYFDIAVAKVRTNETAGLAAAIAHQVHSVIGFTHEHILHFFTRRLWSWRSEYGSDVWWAGELGRASINAGPARFWPSIVARSWQGAVQSHDDAARLFFPQSNIT